MYFQAYWVLQHLKKGGNGSNLPKLKYCIYLLQNSVIEMRWCIDGSCT